MHFVRSSVRVLLRNIFWNGLNNCLLSLSGVLRDMIATHRLRFQGMRLLVVRGNILLHILFALLVLPGCQDDSGSWGMTREKSESQWNIASDQGAILYAFVRDNESGVSLRLATLDGRGDLEITGNLGVSVRRAYSASPNGRWVAFISYLPDEGQRLKVMNVETGAVDEVNIESTDCYFNLDGGIRFTQDGASLWSPDGAYLAYEVNYYGEDCEWNYRKRAWIYDPSRGTSVPVVIPDATIYGDNEPESLQWAPDSSVVSYLSASSKRLYTMTPGGASVRPLPALGMVRSYAWAPDASAIAVYYESGYGDVVGAYSVDPTGSLGARLIPDGEHLRVRSPMVWSPDSRYLAIRCVKSVQGFDNVLYLASPDGTFIQEITPDHQSPRGIGIGLLNWSPDSRYLAFVTDMLTGDSPRDDYYVFSTDTFTSWPWGTKFDQVVQSEQWSPNSRLLAVSTYRRGAASMFRVLATDSRTVLELDNPPGGEALVIQDFEWSPGSDAIAYYRTTERESGYDVRAQWYSIPMNVTFDLGVAWKTFWEPPKWLPSGNGIIFLAQTGDLPNISLYLGDRDGTVTRLSPPMREGASPYDGVVDFLLLPRLPNG